MKKLIVAVLAVLTVFSFTGCAPSGGISNSQSVANRTDIGAIFTDTFKGDSKEISVTYSETAPAGVSAEAVSKSTTKILYAIAKYDGYTGDGDGVIDGMLVFILQTTEENGSYKITSYSTVVPEGETLTITVGTDQHELDIKVKEGTTASGTITKTGNTFTASAVTVLEPSSSEVSVSIDGQNVAIADEPVIPPSPAPSSGFDTLLKDYISLIMTQNTISSIFSYTSESNPTELIDQVDNSIVGHISQGANSVTFTSNNGGKVHVTDDTVVTWTGSAVMTSTYNGDNASAEYKNFKITKIEGSDIPAGYPASFTYSKINGKLSGNFSDTEMFLMAGSLSFDGRKYSGDELEMGMFALYLPMNIVTNKNAFNGTEGDLSSFNSNESPVVIEGKWTNTDGKVSITDGKISAYGMTAYFSFDLSNQPSSNAMTIDAYSFGNTKSQEKISEQNIAFINMINRESNSSNWG